MARTIAAAALLLLAGAAPVRAQMQQASWPVADLQIGYSYLHDDRIAIAGVSGSFPLGWQLSGTYNLVPAFGLVADASGQYKSGDVVPGSGVGDLTLHVHALHAGVRFTARGELRPYAQLLAGVTHSSLDVAGVGTSSTDFSLQPGVGLIFPVSDDIGIGVGMDYRVVFTELEKTKEFRALIGVVFHLSP
jgi:opacity protein-like surface antigen